MTKFPVTRFLCDQISCDQSSCDQFSCDQISYTRCSLPCHNFLHLISISFKDFTYKCIFYQFPFLRYHCSCATSKLNVNPISCNVAELLPFYGLIKQLVKQKIYNLGRRNARPTQVSAVKDLYTTCYLLMESPLLTMNHGHNDRLPYHPRANK